MKCIRILTTYEQAIFATLAGLVVTLTLLLLHVGFRAPILS